MAELERLGQINWQLFIALVLPGFISLKLYSFIHPSEAKALKDSLIEAIAYSAINAALMWWAIVWLITAGNPWIQYALVVLVFFLAPALWPFAVERCLSWAENANLILKRPQTAWDDFFLRRQACWIIVHLADGRRIGGYYGAKSYATLYPQSGHLYIEELWRLNPETGEFEERIQNSGGILLRPNDYHLVELKGIIDDNVRQADARRSKT